MQHTWLEPVLEMFGRRRDDTVHPPHPDDPSPSGAGATHASPPFSTLEMGGTTPSGVPLGASEGPPPGGTPDGASGPMAPSPSPSDRSDRSGRSGPGGPIAVEASVRDLVARHEALHMLLVRMVDHVLVRDLYGEEITAGIESLLVEGLWAAVPGLSGQPASAHHLLPLETGEFLVFWPEPAARPPRLADAAFTMKLKLQHHLKDSVLRWTGREVSIGVGCATYRRRPDAEPRQEFFQAVREARTMARKELDLSDLRLARDFKAVLQDNAIRTLYQPIVRFPTGRIMAWEALSRGPVDTPFHSPMMLFDIAEELGMLFALERICRERAIACAGTLAPDQKLFLNIHPRTLTDPGFTPGSTMEAVRAMGLAPENIVFEITERHSIRDFGVFYKTLSHYRGQGFKVAIDDAGTGYSGLATIAELKPDFIKIDMSLIRNINRDPVRRALMETLVSFAEKIGSRVIAEGIETREEAATLMAIGAHYGQGYYLGRPDYPKTETHVDIGELRPAAQLPSVGGLACSMPVGELAEPAHTVPPTTLVGEVRKLFEASDPLTSIAVVDERHKPLGLIMDYHLNRQLSAQYGVALYFKRPVSAVMDTRPLVVEESTPVEDAARRAMSRSRLQAYDDIMVTRGGVLAGTVSVQRLLHKLAQVQVELAKGTNPLTGLPGNVALEKELETRLAGGQPFSLLYADLDNFKSYNDTYGFKNGDRIILLLAKVLSWAVQRHGAKGDYVAHIGGDDFVCITSPRHAERVCRAATRCFGRLVRGCYCAEDIARGWITARGRDGMERRFPFVSVSLAVLDCHERSNLHEIGERAAHVKHLAKAIPGNAYVLECGVCQMRALH
jgi:EAL domain-containing protein (putative c-di-GMP-specific phosphodiesterase class I)/GGDEF domain-containing protein